MADIVNYPSLCFTEEFDENLKRALALSEEEAKKPTPFDNGGYFLQNIISLFVVAPIVADFAIFFWQMLMRQCDLNVGTFK